MYSAVKWKRIIVYRCIVRLSGVEFPVMNLNDSTVEGILVASWALALGFHTNNRSIYICALFSAAWSYEGIVSRNW